MEESTEKRSIYGDEIEYLHINEETAVNPSFLSCVTVSELWKLSLCRLYGGSKAQRKWCEEIYHSVRSSLIAEKEDEKVSLPIKAIEFGEYLGGDEFEEHTKQCLSLLNEDGSLEGKYGVVSKDLIKLVISEGIYDGRFRSTLKTFSKSLEIDWEDIDQFEQSLVEELVKIRSDEEEREKRRKGEQQKRNLKRAFVIGLTAVGGGAILALSAGLAAPLIGAGAVAVLGSGSAAIFTGASGLAIITSIFGAAGASLAGYKMTKRIGKIEQFEFGALSNGKHLHVALAVSGFCGSDDDAGFSAPWEALGISTEQYYLKWEGKYLRNLGSSIIDFVKREAMQAAVKGILKYTALRAVLKSIAWPLTLISVANLIDNPWNVCTQRSKDTGIHLAHVLLSRHQGYRPITLIGFSLGARAIFYCLQTMLSEKGYEGIIEDVVLIGAPVGVCSEEWEALESVISGTLYNCYSRSDWLLKFVYRAASVQVGDIAGLGPVEVTWPRLVNIDLTEVVNSHSEYAEPTVISNVLQLIGYKTRPVEAPAASNAVKMPHDYVKEISKTPTKILPQSFPLPGKDSKQQQPLEELTAEEQETLDRLTSCQSGTVIENWKSKGGFWKNDDSNSSEDYKASKEINWGKVVSMTMRGSLKLNRKMIGAAAEVPGEGESSSEMTLGLPEGMKELDTYCKDMDDDAAKNSHSNRKDCETVDEKKTSDLELGDNEQESSIQSQVIPSLSENDVGQIMCQGQSSEKESTATPTIKGQSPGDLSTVGPPYKGQSPVDFPSVEPPCKGQSPEDLLIQGSSWKGESPGDPSNSESTIKGESAEDPSIAEAISMPVQALKESPTNSNKKKRSGILAIPMRTERSRSAGDINASMEGKTVRDLSEASSSGSKKDSITIPGRELFSKVCKNVKFALPSPTLSRHKQNTSEKDNSNPTQKKDNEESGSSSESFPGKALRKMSFPGSF